MCPRAGSAAWLTRSPVFSSMPDSGAFLRAVSAAFIIKIQHKAKKGSGPHPRPGLFPRLKFDSS